MEGSRIVLETAQAITRVTVLAMNDSARRAVEKVVNLDSARGKGVIRYY